MKRLCLASLAIMLSQPVIAVDGYKDLKFGMTKEQVIATKVCDMQTGEDTGAIAVLFCENLQFGGGSVETSFYFINEKLEGLTLYVGVDNFVGLATSLGKKYGKPSSSSTRKEFQIVDTIANSAAFIAFAGNTVRLSVTSDEHAEQDATLSYVSDTYAQKLAKAQAEGVKDDI